MKTIRKDELYENLSQFLKSKGIELTEGSYTKGVHAGCSMLADAINLSQAGLERAKNELEKRFDQVRQVIHESTAPRSGAATARPTQASTATQTPPHSREASQARAGKARPRAQARKAQKGKAAKRK